MAKTDKTTPAPLRSFRDAAIMSSLWSSILVLLGPRGPSRERASYPWYTANG
jgi:hypothetical protein